VGLSTFLQSKMVTKNSTESVKTTEAIKFVVLICNHRTYNLPLIENRLHNLHSVIKVKPEWSDCRIGPPRLRPKKKSHRNRHISVVCLGQSFGEGKYFCDFLVLAGGVEDCDISVIV
jgi:hypothetical protein